MFDILFLNMILGHYTHTHIYRETQQLSEASDFAGLVGLIELKISLEESN